MSRFLNIKVLERQLFHEIYSRCGQCKLLQVSTLRTTPELSKDADKKFRWKKFWRTKNQPISGLTLAYGPFTDLPDYSYLDGRPTPLTIGQMRRKLERIQTTSLIMESLAEIELAETKYREQTEAQRDKRQRIIDSKLTPKGDNS